jgi:hypothetical protein
MVTLDYLHKKYIDLATRLVMFLGFITFIILIFLAFALLISIFTNWDLSAEFVLGFQVFTVLLIIMVIVFSPLAINLVLSKLLHLKK